MSGMPLVSVVVPVYKVEEFLPKCLASLASQTYKNLEIILVDDGSPDKCGVMCDEFASKRSNVLVIHQENRALSGARNNGVLKSKGEYITFIDSDDYVSADYVEYMVFLILKYNADISIGKYVPVYLNSKNNIKINDSKNEQLLSKEEAMIEACYANKFGVSAWAKLYKRNLVEQHPYPEGKLYEELATTYKIISETQKVVYGDKTIYYYTQRSGSIIGDKQLYGLQAAREQLSFMEANYPSVVHAARVRVVIKVQQYMPALFCTNKDKRLFYSLRKELIPYYKETIADKYVGNNLKIKVFSIKCGYYPALFVYRVIRKLRFGE